MLDFSRFECLNFDCYGTLIDWQSGILKVFQAILHNHRIVLSDTKVLEMYGELEAAEQKRSYRPYREVLKGVVVASGDRLGFRPSLQEIESLPHSLPSWQPFPDTIAALHKLKTKFQLAILSNVDDDLFAGTARSLQVKLDWVITAQQAGSYKPAFKNFQLAMERMALPKEKILHVAQSLYHDIAPAHELGLSTVWVNRPGSGAVKRPATMPHFDLETPDLKSLAQAAFRKA